MSLLGKILALLNVLAALMFLVLASMDVQKRQEWSRAVFLHQLVIDGLPLEGPEPWSHPKGYASTELSEDILRDLFQKVKGGAELGGGPVDSQQAELKRVWSVLQERIGELDSAAKKKERLRTILTTLARVGDERDAVLARASDPKVTPDDLMNDLRRRFEAAEQPLRVGSDPQRDAAEKRLAIAQLLYSLSPEPEWQYRVMLVVGLDVYSFETERQAETLSDMVARTQRLVADDRLAFEIQFRRLVQQRTQVLAEQVAQLTAVLENQKKLTDKHSTLVKARMTDIEELKVQLEKAQEATRKALAVQGELEKDLFFKQREMGLAAGENARLEREIRLLELGQ
ncbi:MAG: hypothetical protein NZ700_15945 [Gemmataceae bacterium]|nr:hypothetical protein [Gemmataceae bacterium]MDW8264430.1 hypothetical protein [Gemmataceae bacterium]